MYRIFLIMLFLFLGFVAYKFNKQDDECRMY
jgi:hypothetical protein